MLKIHIPGQPRGKERARSRIVKQKNGNQFVSHYTPTKTKTNENNISTYAQMAMVGKKPIEDPIKITLLFMFDIPTSWPKWKKELALTEIAHTAKPDVDNLVKSVLDGFNGIVWTDDCLVVSVKAEKRYSLKPCVYAIVETIDKYPAQISGKP